MKELFTLLTNIEKRLTSIENLLQERKKRVKNPPPKPLFDFEIVYSHYPRKQGKKGGFEWCAKNIRTQRKFDRLLKATKIYAEHIKKTGEWACHFENFCKKYEDKIPGPDPVLDLIKHNQAIQRTKDEEQLHRALALWHSKPKI